MHRVVCGNLQPDLTILLRPDFDASLQRARRRNDRMAARGTNENRFEQEQTAFFRRVFDKYSEIAQREALRVVTIEDDAPLDVVTQRIVSLVDERLAKHRGESHSE
jgi:dTMP kinase